MYQNLSLSAGKRFRDQEVMNFSKKYRFSMNFSHFQSEKSQVAETIWQ